MAEGFHLKTLNDVLAMVTGRGETQAMLAQPLASEPGVWKPITSNVLYGRVRALAAVFQGWGVGKGDRIVILSENRWEWAVTDLAALAIGAIDVPLYPTLTAEELGYSLRNSGAKVAVLSSAKQYEKLAGAGELAALERVVVMDEGEFGNAESFTRLMDAASSLEAHDQAFDSLVASAQPDDIATIIYTSGTTGEPKGAELTHGNLAQNLNVSTEPYSLTDKDSSISYLPLSHVVARHLDYAMMAHGARIAYCPVFNDVATAMKVTKPTVFVGVPRVFEKIRHTVEGKSAETGGFSRKIFDWALKTGDGGKDAVLAGRHPSGVSWALANMLVFGKIRAAFGGCVRIFIAGGAALGTDTAEWYARVGIRIFEGYGLTETSPVIARNSPRGYKLGSVGKLVENIEARIAHDGEIEVKGPSVFKHYWGKDEETAKAFTEDGWFKTGDIGRLEDGFLTITDRKKELLKTSGGKLIPPQPIESKLKANELVGQACMVGDKHKFAAVLISPNFAALEKWGGGHGASGDHSTLVGNEAVVKEYQRIVDDVNKDLPPYETMKRVCVVPDEWTLEGGELTPSMKLKRRVILEKYQQQIDEMYKDEDSAKAE